MNPSASNVVNDHSLDYTVYNHLTMRVTETMGRVRGGSKKKAVKKSGKSQAKAGKEQQV